MTDNSLALLLGAFLTSPGFGGMAAAAAAIVAFVNVNRTSRENRAAQDRTSRENRAAQDVDDERARWWQLLEWFYDHHQEMDQATGQRVLSALQELRKTKQQTVILLAVNRVVKDYWAREGVEER